MSSEREKTALDERVLQRLARLPDAASREKLLERHRELLHTEVVAQLAEAVRERVRVNSHEALGLAEMALAIAAKLADSESQAPAVRAKANALYALGQNQAAIELHQQARELFASLGNAGEVARTLSASLQPLILLGQYDRAFAACDEAAQIFARQNQPLGLARLEINRGNILHRQDRFDEALACYQRAYGELLPRRDTEGIAATLSNMAVCLVSLNDFPRALACYEQARAFCAEHGMPRLVAQADYNIACARMKKHPEYGWAVLRLLPGLKSTSVLVLHHHESFDGRGYPAGLKETEIPLGARIVSVIDAFDAMVSSRPYRAGLPLDEAIRRLILASGTQFDPVVVQCFLHIARAEMPAVFAAAGTGVSAAL